MAFKKLGMIALCIASIISVKGILASDTRVHSLANVPEALKDYHNILNFPTTIVNYPNLMILGFGGSDFSYDGETSSNTTPFAGGTIQLMQDHVFGVLVSGKNETLPYTPIDTDYQFDLFYGLKFNKLMLGVRINRASGIDKVSGYPEQLGGWSGNYEKSVTVTGITVGGGMELSGFDLAEVALHYQTTAFTDESNGQTNTEPEGYQTMGLKARFFYGLKEKTDLICFTTYENKSNGQQTYQNNEKASAQTSTSNSLMMGLGLNHRPAENMLLIAGVAYLGINTTSEYKPVVGENQKTETSSTGLPIAYIGFEAQLKSWLHFRTGAQKLVGDVESKQKISNNTITTENGYSKFGFAVGIGVEFQKLSIDFMLDRDYLKRGPYILSGATGRMFPRATATYAF